MAAAELKLEVTCSICTDVYTNPVTLICGHSFCQDCINKTFDNQHDREYFCPECMKGFSRRPELKKNLRLANIADHFHSVEPKGDEPKNVCSYCVNVHAPAVTLCLHCEAFLCDVHKATHSKSPEHVLVDPTTSLEDRRCPDHKKILEYYCFVDDTFICSHCLASEHSGHKVSTTRELLQQKTKDLQPILEKLSSKRQESEAMLQSLQDNQRTMDDRADGIGERVTAIMRVIRRKQVELEKRILTDISRRKQKISRSVSGRIQQLENERAELQKKIHQIEELSTSTNPLSVSQTQNALFCILGDEQNSDGGTDNNTIHDPDDLEEAMILETLHSGLSNIVAGSGKDVHGEDTQMVSPSATYSDINIGNEKVSHESQAEAKAFKHEPHAHTPHQKTRSIWSNTKSKAMTIWSNTKLKKRNTDLGTEVHQKHVMLTPGFLEYYPGLNYKDCDIVVPLAFESDEESPQSAKSKFVLDEDDDTALAQLLDVNTAGSYLFISEDLKTVSRSDVYLDRPKSLERFVGPQVLSTGGISSGKHGLEMEISKSEGDTSYCCFIGMCYPTIDRGGSGSLGGGSTNAWGIWVTDTYYQVIENNDFTWLRKMTAERIKVELDYEGGQLTFSAMCDPIQRLHTFSATFTEPLHLIICIQGNGRVKILT